MILQSKRSLAYGASSEMQQHTSDNVYDNGGQHQQHLQSQQHYLSSSPHVQQPLPASTMASSVAALQRLSASIDVTAVPATAVAPSSRSNSRASAYDETSDKSEAVLQAAQSREAAEAAAAAAVEASGIDSGRPQYLTANCVVYSFYNGDLTAAIDDHFNRALKTSNERDSPNHSESAKQQSGKSKLENFPYFAFGGIQYLRKHNFGLFHIVFFYI